jgi:hypothetical protein
LWLAIARHILFLLKRFYSPGRTGGFIFAEDTIKITLQSRVIYNNINYLSSPHLVHCLKINPLNSPPQRVHKPCFFHIDSTGQSLKASLSILVTQLPIDTEIRLSQ